MMSAALMAVLPLAAQKESQVRLFPDQAKQSIPKEIYGQFAEHLGTCIYGPGCGWARILPFPIRTVTERCASGFEGPEDTRVALAGRLFADEYHWMDGIGPKENRRAW